MTDSGASTLVPDHRASWWVFALIGVAGGILSGLFGIGGGIIMVPAFVAYAKMTQKMAAGTSLAAIVPVSAVGSISYALSGNVDWLAALLLAIGAIVGAQLGTYLMSRIPSTGLLWGFVTLQTVLIVSLWFTVPDRDATMVWNPLLLTLVALLGLLTGVLAGLLGVGGGIVVVPALIAFFGLSDLTAKGTSLVMMIPGAISGTIANFSRGYVDMRGALIAGLVAAALTPVGALMAAAIDPRVGNILLAILIVFAAVRMVVSHYQRRKR